MCEVLSKHSGHLQELSEAAPEFADRPTGATAASTSVDVMDTEIKTDSFQHLLSQLERHPSDGDRRHLVDSYQAWISRAGASSLELFAAWFNLGVELTRAGDRPGAIEAYRSALAARPGFGPAVLNLGILLGSSEPPAVEQQPAPAGIEVGVPPEDGQTSTAATGSLGQGTRDVLHVGCGAFSPASLPPVFHEKGWQEIRLDIDPNVEPDFIASITDMHVISDGMVDAVYSSHNVEHLYPHEVAVALREMRRVLKPTGFVLIKVPDLQAVASHVAEGRLEEAVYLSSMGPIAPLDILYGHRQSLAKGNSFMAHRTGFTCVTLATALLGAGFAAALVQRDSGAFALSAIAFRTLPDHGSVARAQAQMFPLSDHPAVLYTPPA